MPSIEDYGWTSGARELPATHWVTAQVLRASDSRIHVMLCKLDMARSCVLCRWVDEDGVLRDEPFPTADVVAWKPVNDNDRVPEHVPRRQRLQLVKPLTSR